MALIELETVIDAPLERVFDLACSIDAHQDSAVGTRERAVAGVREGLIRANDEVTWEARHFGITQRLSVKITRFDRPNHFQDTMLKGPFRRMQHDHSFEDQGGRTLMRDRFEFQSPLGFLGWLADALVLTAYMRRFILKRHAILKQVAEGHAWEKYLNGPVREI